MNVVFKLRFIQPETAYLKKSEEEDLNGARRSLYNAMTPRAYALRMHERTALNLIRPQSAFHMALAAALKPHPCPT